MKLKTLLLALEAVAVMCSCSFRSHPVKALGHLEDVHHVHIPNWVMALVGTGNKEYSKDIDNIEIKSIRDLYVYGTDNEKSAGALCDKARQIAKNNGYELALKAREDGEHADIYVKQRGKRTSLMIIGKDSDGETSVVSMCAKISAGDLSKLISNK